MTPRLAGTGQADRRHPTERGEAMNGWLMWGLILPVLLIVAGIVTIRRRNHRS